MWRYIVCVLMFGFGFALAHQGYFSVDDLEFIEAGGVRFLTIGVAYEEHDALLKLSAVLIDGTAAVLEQRRLGAALANRNIREISGSKELESRFTYRPESEMNNG